MRIGPRLISAFAATSLLTMAVVFLSLSLSGHIEKLRTVELPMVQNVREVEENLWASLGAADSYRISPDPTHVQRFEEAVHELEQQWAEYGELTDLPQERDFMAAFEEAWARVKGAARQMIALTDQRKAAEDAFFELVDQADDVIDFQIQEQFRTDDPHVLAKEQSVREVEVSIWEAIHAAQQYTGLSPHITRVGHSQKTFAELMEKQFTDVAEFWGKYRALPLTAEERAAADGFEAIWKRAATEGRRIIKSHDQGVQQFHSLLGFVREVGKIIDDRIEPCIEQRVAQRDAAGRQVRVVTLAIGLAAIVAAMGIGAWMTRSVCRPMDRLRAAAEQVARGRLDCRVHLRRRDEIGEVAGAFDHMLDELVASSRRLEGEVAERTRAEGGLRDANRKLKAAKERLEQANAELRDFVYIASHDLREPLRKISSFGAMLAESLGERLDKDDRENFEFMIDGANRMTRMIEGLLTYSRLNTRQQQWEPVDLGALAGELTRLELAARVEETGAEVSVAPEPAPVRGNPDEIRQLMANLIGNAIKYRREGVRPRVHIEAAPAADGFVRVTVDDNGIGIPPEHRQDVFRMFRRLHTRSRYDGAGIGLAICRKVVDKHGGQIGIDAGELGGTRVWFTLPAAERAPQPAHAAAAHGDSPADSDSPNDRRTP